MPAHLQSLTLNALRVELRRRDLDTTGTRRILQARLQNALPTAPLSVPSTFDPSRTHVAPPPPPPPPPSDRPKALLLAGSIIVLGPHIDQLRAAAPIGKGNLSRSQPTYANPHQPTHGRAARQLAELERDAQSTRQNVEHLQLMPVEAFHAAYIANHLLLYRVSDTRLSSPLSSDHVWRHFCALDPHFPPRFAAYARYVAAGWLPRSGLKYGVDWVLYPSSVAKRHMHSPYCVVLCFQSAARVEREWIVLQNRLRLVKNVAKTLIVADVSCVDHDVNSTVLSFRDALKAFSVRELTIDRWLP